MMRKGFTLLEVLFATIFIGLIAYGVAHVLSASTVTTREERHRLHANLIAHSELARLRTAGALSMEQADTFRVNKLGLPAEDGDYLVEISTDVACEGGLETYDNSWEPNPFGDSCAGERPVGIVQVSVHYPAGRGIQDRVMALRIALGHTAVFSESLGDR